MSWRLVGLVSLVFVVSVSLHTLVRGLDCNGDGVDDGSGCESLFPRSPVSIRIPDLRPRTVTTVDVNQDGLNDLIVTEPDADRISVLISEDGELLWRQRTASVGQCPFDVVVDDFNRDGVLDFATANYFSNDVTVVTGREEPDAHGTPRWIPGATGAPMPVGVSPIAITSGDFDRNGASDLAVVNDDDIFLLFNRGDGTFRQPPKILEEAGTAGFLGIRELSAVDVNGNGALDWAIATGSGACVRLNLGDGRFRPAERIEAGGVGNFAVSEFGASRRFGFVFAGRTGVHVVLPQRGRSGRELQLPRVAFGDYFSIAVADFDGDGFVDVAATLRDQPRVDIFPWHVGSEIVSRRGPRFTLENAPFSLAIGDLDRDGKPDLVTSSIGSEVLTVLVSGDDAVPPRDCNRNGVDDGEDIGSGVSADLNADALPDECENRSTQTRFVRGDCDGNGTFGGTPTEAIVGLEFSFGTGEPPPCLAACDAEADGSLTITDYVLIRRSAFLGLGRPDLPFPNGGPGVETDLALGCEAPPPCR